MTQSREQSQIKTAPAKSSHRPGLSGIIALVADIAGIVTLAFAHAVVVVATCGALAVVAPGIALLGRRGRTGQWRVAFYVLLMLLGSGVIGGVVGNETAPRTVLAARAGSTGSPAPGTGSSASEGLIGVTSSPGPSTSSDPTMPGPVATGPTYLADLDPVNGSGDYGGKGSATFSGKEYDTSVRVGCGPASSSGNWVEWDSATYQQLTAVLGFDDNDSQATDAVATVQITNQAGGQLLVVDGIALGAPKPVDVRLGGATRIRVRCIAKDTADPTRSAVPVLALGNATFTS